MKWTLLLLLSGVAGFLYGQAAPPSPGPVIGDFGAVFSIPDPDFPVDPERLYMVVFDIAESPAGHGEINPLINTLARFLNMHAQAGVPPGNMRLAAVLHGGAAKDALTQEAYRSRYQSDNPNVELMRQLAGAGVRLYICGQSMGARGFERAEIAGPVGIALSAMTVLVTLQGEGFQLIRF